MSKTIENYWDKQIPSDEESIVLVDHIISEYEKFINETSRLPKRKEMVLVAHRIADSYLKRKER